MRTRKRLCTVYRPVMPRPAVNMIDVAQAAGVSVGTVSRALSGNKGVSEHTRRRIQQIADDLGYVVSPAASSLAAGKTGRVGLVTPQIAPWFYANMIDAIAEELHRSDLEVLLYLLNSEQERARFFQDLPARRRVDAVIVVAFPIDDNEWHRIDTMEMPVVVAGYVLPARPSAGINDELAAMQAVNHLLGLGHRRIAMISSQDREGLHYTPDLSRQRGYLAAMRKAGLEAEQHIVSADWGIEGGNRGMDILLSQAELPTAIFAFSDEMAIGAMQSLRKVGLQPGRDISVVGIDDHPMAALTDLTTVGQDVRAQGLTAGRLCVDLLNNNATDLQVTCPTRLIVRRTTGAPTATPDVSTDQPGVSVHTT